MTIKEAAKLAGFMVSTIRKWQREGKVPPAPADGSYTLEDIDSWKTYRQNALSIQSKNRWDKLTPNQRTEVAKKQWTPERKVKQSKTMEDVRAGRTGLTPEKLEEWNTNSKNAANTREVREAKARGANDLWAERTAELRRARCEKLLSGKRAWMQTAGKYLLDHPDALNDEIAEHIDSIGLLRKDGKRWVEAIRGPSVTNDFGDLRKLLGMPGGTFRRTKSVKSFVALT
jgi:DNA-binding transcriptional MerR regulator